MALYLLFSQIFHLCHAVFHATNCGIRFIPEHFLAFPVLFPCYLRSLLHRADKVLYHLGILFLFLFKEPDNGGIIAFLLGIVQALIILCFPVIPYNKWHDIAPQALLEQDEPSRAAVAVLKGVDLLKLSVELC